ncbi:PEP-CTERM sorting domain-containing protein [Corynebacterium sanguinis]|uniref:PEP-CTERM sorting domain-containing protein n=1 Tax=Corynebacterium sanguinis TaxID=2594913 RepID=UPI0021AE3A5F|nr:PEP-CTERM sorting domain-containing protein [Corynebacterium sanguinis]MCT1444949.1 PEP-CTERM sorting domain-containing protein [Corynebacterium sanguinis]MCT2155047.1 PEP-CTERM sorting domain-containing protein [Corynebacterium sanguinis]
MRRDLVWQTLIGFVGFFTVLALVQAVFNLFRPEPAIWPGLLAGALCLATFLLVRRWLRWRAGPGA